MFFKKAQVGSTMTWVLATIIIIVILLIFIYSSTLLAGFKKIEVGSKSFLSGGIYLGTNFSINTKTAMAYIVSGKNSDIKNWADDSEINLEEYVK